ncbi:hypothetical protein ABK040_013669 [Willaertia magna]
MFRNFGRASFKTCKNSQNFKVLNQNVRTFTSAQSSTGLNNPAVRSLIAGGVMLVGGYAIMKTLNKPATVYGRYGDENATNIVQEQYLSSNTHVPHSIDPVVSKYLKGTFGYVGLNVVLTALSAAVAFKTGLPYRIASMNSWLYLGLMLGGTYGTMYLTRATQDPVLKHLGLLAFNGVMGVSLCTLGLMFKPQMMLRAALFTGGILGALSFAAMNAKNETFLNMGGPLLAGLVVVFLSSLAPLVLPSTARRALEWSEKIWLYGGLLLFCAFVLYDTQLIMKKGENYRHYVQQQRQLGNYAIREPDYINSSFGLYFDAINIFIRILYIMGNNQRKH